MLKKHGREKDYKKDMSEDQVENGMTYERSKENGRILKEYKGSERFLRVCDAPYKGAKDHIMLVHTVKNMNLRDIEEDDRYLVHFIIEDYREKGYDIIQNGVDSSSIKDVLHIHFVKY